MNRCLAASLTARSKGRRKAVVQVYDKTVGTLSVAISSRGRAVRPKLLSPHTGRCCLCVLASGTILHCIALQEEGLLIPNFLIVGTRRVLVLVAVGVQHLHIVIFHRYFVMVVCLLGFGVFVVCRN